jgi:two-component system, NtrC family, response regulator HydG
LLAHVARGDLVTVLTLSRGGVGGTAEQRRREARSASSAMSAQLMVADFVDTEIHSDPDLIRVIERVVAEVNPDTIYVHSANDTHQDHQAVHVATLSAARGVPRIFSYQSPSATNNFAPTRYVPIDQTVEGKVEVLSHYQSQAHRRYMDPDLVRATARYWARQLPTGVVFAEPFEVLRTAEQSSL